MNAKLLKYPEASKIKWLIKASFFFLQLILKITQTHTLYTSLSFYIIFTIFHNIGSE